MAVESLIMKNIYIYFDFVISSGMRRPRTIFGSYFYGRYHRSYRSYFLWKLWWGQKSLNIDSTNLKIYTTLNYLYLRN